MQSTIKRWIPTLLLSVIGALGLALGSATAVYADSGDKTAPAFEHHRGKGGAGHQQGGPGYGRDHHMGQGHHGGPQGKGNQMGPHGRRNQMGPAMRYMISKLSPEKREQARKIRVEMRQKINLLQAQLKNLHLDMRELMRAYPVDQSGALAKRDQMAKLQREMMGLRLASLAAFQNLAGKKLWDEAHTEMAKNPGRGFGPGMHPRRER